MIGPTTTSWLEALPVLLVALGVLVFPGTVAVRLLGQSWWTAMAAGPPVGVAALTLAGIAFKEMGIPWSGAAFALTTGALVLVAGLVGLILRRRAQPRPLPGRALALWAVAGAVLAVVLGASPVVSVTGRPDAVPQGPDTVFHIGTIMMMVATGDASSLQASAYAAGQGQGSYYPAAFHVVAATVALLTGSQAIVAANSLAVVAAVVVWPVGVMALAREVFGDHPVVLVASPVAAIALAPFPTWFLGYGVLWPNLLGQALVAGTVAVIVGQIKGPRSVTGALVALLAICGVALAHPNALVGLAVVAAPAVLAWALQGMLPGRPMGLRVLVGVATLMASALAVTGWYLATRLSSMQLSNPPGPEATWGEAIVDLLFAAAREIEPSWAVGALVVMGMAAVLRRNRPWWVAVAWLLTAALYLMVAAVDSPQTRVLTWPWYNNTPRLAALVVLPSTILLVAALLLLHDRSPGAVSRATGGRVRVMPGSPAATVTVLVIFLVLSLGAGIPSRAATLRAGFHPPAELSFVSDQELASLRALGRLLPSDAVVAANPWRGGQYLFPISGQRLLYPTEKVREATPENLLLARRLSAVGQDPAVCAAARAKGVEWALVGGQAATPNDALGAYRGIDSIPWSSSWELVRTEEPFSLYRRTACASP